MRVALPYRRMNASLDCEFEGARLTICLGFDQAGRVREVFASGHKAGSTMQRLIEDACVVISVALQHGVAGAALAESLGRVPCLHGRQVDRPASPIGVIFEAIAGHAVPGRV